jgi:arsenate reductase
MIIIYHNIRCGKSREALEFLTQKGIEFEIVEYLKNPLTEFELQELIQLLQIKPIDLVRTKEKIWQENYKDIDFTEIELLKIIAENPILIERPIVVNGKKALIARPKELINNIL